MRPRRPDVARHELGEVVDGHAVDRADVEELGVPVGAADEDALTQAALKALEGLL